MSTLYVSKPIARFKLGRFQFEDGVLRLESEEDVAEFDALLDKQPPFLRQKVKKSTQEMAEAVAASFLKSRMVSGVDTTGNSTMVQSDMSPMVPPIEPDVEPTPEAPIEHVAEAQPAKVNPLGGLQFGRSGAE